MDNLSQPSVTSRQPLSRPAVPHIPSGRSPALLEGEAPLSGLQRDQANFSTAARELLAQAYQKLQSTGVEGQPLQPASDTPTPQQQSAGVILDFIRGRLEKMDAEGADAEALQATFEQGLAGFRKGLEEARRILQGLNALNESVSGGIAETEQLVLGGLQTLADEWGLDASALQSNTEPSPASNSQAAVNPTGALHSRAAYFAGRIERQESVELEIATRDGDIITLTLTNSASREGAVAAAYASTPRGSAGVLAYRQVEQSSSQFSFSVQGELDDDERQALELLLNDISALSDEFFAGNFSEAFDMALSLDFDASEFSSLSLDLSLLTRASVFAGSQQSNVDALPEQASSVAREQVADNNGLGQLQQLLDLLDRAGRFDRPQHLLTDLLAGRLAQSSSQQV